MEKIKPLIYWPGLRPVSLITKNIVKKFGDDLVFVSSPTFDQNFKEDKIEVFEQELGHKIIWLDNPNDIYTRRKEFADRNLIVHTGWNNKGWLQFDKYMKDRGAKIVLTADNCLKKNFRQYLGAIYFRVFLRKLFDAVFITGESSYQLMKFFGVPEDRIFKGLLGSDSELYYFDKNIAKKNEFLFVGQLIKRKNFDIVVKAYEKYIALGGTYSLRVIGGGELSSLIKKPIIYDGFLSPSDVVKKMQQAKCLILPSQEDHWPTVLHEMISCGGFIIPSSRCGNHIDLLDEGLNGFLLKSITDEELVEKMFAMENISSEMFLKGQEKSLKTAKKFGCDIYEKSFDDIILKLF